MKKLNWLIVVAGIVFLLVYAYVKIPRSSQRFVRNDITSSQNRGYGIITVTTNGSKTIYTGGNSVIGVPLGRVSWEEYHDGKLTRILTPTPAKNSMDFRSVNLPFKEISWKLVPNQELESVQFAYYLYTGSAPPPDWYNTVLRNCRQ